MKSGRLKQWSHLRLADSRLHMSLQRTKFAQTCRFLAIAFFACYLVTLNSTASAQSFFSNSRLVLGTEANKSASVRLADLDGDRVLDAVVANGRHWPQANFVFLNQGKAKFNVSFPLGQARSTSYSAELADLDGDGDVDIVVGNDMAPCKIFLNDGKAGFTFHQTFGGRSSVRSMKTHDLDRDGDQDILVTCRGRSNLIFLNDGKANFSNSISFGTRFDSTIDVDIGDVNSDGHLDLLLANRDDQPNCWLMNNGNLKFDKSMPFGIAKANTRAVSTGDFDGDGNLDWAVGNIDQTNQLFLGNGKGSVTKIVNFGRSDGRTYCMEANDLDQDGDLDLIVGNAGQPNSVFFNHDHGAKFRQEIFDKNSDATYGLSVGDINGDGKADIVVANSDSPNRIYLNRIAIQKTNESNLQQSNTAPTISQTDWPVFRGPGGRGVADGSRLPEQWNADSRHGPLKNVLWQVDVPGLGHSSPVVAGNKLFLLTAVAKSGKAPIQVQSGGRPTAADDNGTQDWILFCFNKLDGKKLWSKVLHSGKPRATRHAKATHANTSVCVVEDKLVCFLGSEGLYCLDVDGKPIWKQDLGVVNISKYGIGWGFSSSPAVHEGKIALVCDDPDNPYICVRDLKTGKEVWRKTRKGICERSWGTPYIHQQNDTAQIVVNGWPWIVSYDLRNGDEIWKLKGGGDNPVPTPFESNGLIYITNAHGGPSPIFAIRPEAKGLLDKKNSKSIAWYVDKGGSYMSTPVVYRNQIYLGQSNGAIRTFDSNSGKKIAERRLGSNAGVIASLVAGDGKVYCASENGTVYVLQHGPELKIIAKNLMGKPCLATPAISDGVVFIRTTERLIAIGE